MRLVVDSNLLVALFVQLDYSPQARARFRDWVWQGVEVVAPQLWFYEAISTLRKLSALGRLSAEEAQEAADELGHLEVQAVEPSSDLGRRALAWAAGELGQPGAARQYRRSVLDRQRRPGYPGGLLLLRR